MPEKPARIISIIFHPLLVPTLGFILLFASGFFNSVLTNEAKRFVLLVVFFTTAILPLLSVSLLAINPKFDYFMTESHSTVLPLLFASLFYYSGFILLGKIHFISTFKLFMIASVLAIVGLLLVSFKWKISIHMAAAGAITATFFALSFRMGANPVAAIVIVVVVSGMIGSARLALQKNNLLQIAAGYLWGFVVLYPVIYFF